MFSAVATNVSDWDKGTPINIEIGVELPSAVVEGQLFAVGTVPFTFGINKIFFECQPSNIANGDIFINSSPSVSATTPDVPLLSASPFFTANRIARIIQFTYNGSPVLPMYLGNNGQWVSIA